MFTKWTQKNTQRKHLNLVFSMSVNFLMKCNYATFKVFLALSKVALYFFRAFVAGPFVTVPLESKIEP